MTPPPSAPDRPTEHEQPLPLFCAAVVAAAEQAADNRPPRGQRTPAEDPTTGHRAAFRAWARRLLRSHLDHHTP